MEYKIVFIYALILGSYLNVLGTRSFSKSEENYLRSYCDQCKRTLTPLELIPVLSFIIQRGRCKGCREKISIIYPVMELFTGFVLTYLFWIYGWSQEFCFYSMLIILLIILTVSDIFYYKISNRLLFMFTPILLILSPLSLRAILIGVGVQLLIFLIAIFVFPSSIGMGDVKLFLLLGAVTGYHVSLWVLCLSSIFGILYFILFKPQRIPFVPFILSGLIIVQLMGVVIELNIFS